MFEDDFDDYMNPARFRAELRSMVAEDVNQFYDVFVELDNLLCGDGLEALANVAGSVNIEDHYNFAQIMLELRDAFPHHDDQLATLAADEVAFERAKPTPR
jgi:hypothetical protein